MFNKIIRFIQLLFSSVLIITENLTSSHPLLMRHVYTKKILHLTFLTTNMKLIVSLGIIIITFLLYKRFTKCFSLSIVTAIVLIFIWLPLANSMLTYTYGVAISLCIYVLEVIILTRNSL